ncbi:M23 family metallopeptidase [Sphingomonas nostoxanthinifaciens]|uniref:M23 family metallopeptidase n=1 Tax=Sphingomonas nostoxanthinifaciens TaxID=2872652 RepID=UPI001CC1EB89|nr:M23 family metallopeptidase [Sphingomonas nostoxanthinifaciens]UAK24809.1 M23 family metallopeptidase [Sphingomonas nostoxanthinifaciens]
MYLRQTEGFGGGGTVAIDGVAGARAGQRDLLRRMLDRAAQADLVVDLGQRIGSGEWWRGLATCTALCGAAVAFAPTLHPLPGASPAPLTDAQAREMRLSAIAPQAYGADTGQRVAASATLVERLTDTPERPQIQVSTTLGQGDGFARVLARAGVGADEARQVADLVAQATTLGDIKPGTKLDLTLGRRPNKQVARPLDHLAFRAKLELALEVNRVDGVLKLKEIPIAVDETPLRIVGRVGSSLLAAARNAGAPAKAIETYLRAIGQHLAIRSVGANDHFDLILAHRRAATGETETGGLLYAGLDEGKKQLRLLKWDLAGREQWFDAAGVGEQRGEMKMPVQGHLTSSFGMRFHPILGFSRMHQGMDYGAPMGAPIVAAADGVISFAGRHGGHGNYVQIRHDGAMGTGYAHMSRIIARMGEHVRAGQLIGYVGSTGLSTGPHLHFEVFKNNVAVNPLSVKFTQAAQLAGSELQRFRATLARLLSVRKTG